MTLKAKLLGTFLAVAALNAVGALLLFQSAAAQRTNAVVINLAGAQRMLTQKIAKDALLLGQHRGDPGALRPSADRFQRVLVGLLDGDAELGLPASQDAAIREQLNKVQSLWRPFGESLSKLASGAGGDGASLRHVIDHNAQLLAESNKAVGLLEEWSSVRTKRMFYAQVSAVGLLIGLLSLVWFRVIGPLVKQLTGAIGEITEGAGQLANAAGQISSTSQSLAQGSSEQAATLEETSAASEEINAMARKNSESSRAAAGLMTQSQQKFVQTNESLDQMVVAMSEINAQSGKISKIIKVIDEIAFQTNILALNAAVEAARAGEAGMGFAVVADEVRTLAQRSAQAAKDTAALIEESIAKSNDGKARVDAVAAAIRQITGEVVRMKALVDEVSGGSQQQTLGIEQVAQAIAQMEQVTQKTAADSEESAAAAEEINAQALSMREIVNQLHGLVDGTHARV